MRSAAHRGRIEHNSDAALRHLELIVMCKTYDEFEAKCQISGSSPEAYYAESAWNHALKEALRLVEECAKTEGTVGGLVMMIHEEISAINTDFYNA